MPEFAFQVRSAAEAYTIQTSACQLMAATEAHTMQRSVFQLNDVY